MDKEFLTRTRRLGLIATAILMSASACSNGGTGGAGATTHRLVATPATLGSQNAYPTQVLVTGVAGTATIAVADRSFADLGSPIVSGSSLTFTVSPVAGGNTSIAVSDAGGASLTIPLSTAYCLPPVPNVSLLAENLATASPSPAPGAGQHPVTYSTIFVTTSIGMTYVTNFSLRLIGSDGSTYEGPALAPASQAPAVTGATPAPAPSGVDEYFEPAPALAPHTEYRVQLLGERCLPPDVFGSFST